MNRRLAEAVIDAFRETERDAVARQLTCLRLRDWRRGLHWLDASGLALYFRNQMRTAGLEECVPPEILDVLDERAAFNKLRTSGLVKEWAVINCVFQKAGLRYINLKGFTLVPDYCPDPSLRCQFDMDFMISPSDLDLSKDILKTFGYVVTGAHKNVVEFKAGIPQIPSIQDLYKPRSQRAVEMHVVPMTHAAPVLDNGPLSRLQTRVWNGVTFPTLSEVDMFLAQANHLLRHLKSEWTRVSWLLEFRTFINSRSRDTQFWRNVRSEIATNDEDALAVGIAVLLTTEVFGEFGPPELAGWSIEAVPRSVRLWLERFGRTVLLSDFPGTKLYLLLDRELAKSENARAINWSKLFPMHRPPPVAYADSGGLAVNTRACLSQIWFTLYRLRFHLVEGSRCLIATQQWKRRVSGQTV